MNLGPFEDLPSKDREAVAACATLRDWAAGETLYGVGDPADSLMIVQSGVFAVQVPGPNGDLVVLTLLGEDSLFGEVTLVGAPRRSAEVAALVAGQTAVIAIPRLDELRGRSREIDDAVMGVMSDTIRRLTRQVVEARQLAVPERLRATIVHLHHLFGRGRVHLTQGQLAQLVGAQRTTVSELLARDAEAGLIATGRGWLEVLDEAGLRSASTAPEA